MNALAMFRVLSADARRHHCAPVSSLRNVLVVSEAGHQSSPGVRDLLEAPACLGWLAGEAVAGKRRTNDVERIRGIAAVGNWIRERFDHLLEFDDRSGPAVSHDEGLSVRLRGLHVNEVNVEPVQVSHELREAVELRFAVAPIVFLAPVLADFLNVSERDPLRPVFDGLFVGPACIRESLLEV